MGHPRVGKQHMRMTEMARPPPLRQYTLDSALRILHVKNMGRDLAPEELRICP